MLQQPRQRPQAQRRGQLVRQSKQSDDIRSLLLWLRVGLLPEPKEASNLAHHVRVSRLVADIHMGQPKVKA